MMTSAKGVAITRQTTGVHTVMVSLINAAAHNRLHVAVLTYIHIYSAVSDVRHKEIPFRPPGNLPDSPKIAADISAFACIQRQ